MSHEDFRGARSAVYPTSLLLGLYVQVVSAGSAVGEGELS